MLVSLGLANDQAPVYVATFLIPAHLVLASPGCLVLIPWVVRDFCNYIQAYS